MTHSRMQALAAVLLLSVCACGCSIARTKRIEECKQNLLLVDKRMFGLESVRQCLCKGREEGLDGKEAMEACDAECMMALPMVSSKLFYSEEFTRCVCDGLKTKREREAVYAECTERHGAPR